jgi:Ca2+-binding RTX toxin-like protein
MSLHSWLRSLRARIALSQTVRRVNAETPRALQLAEVLEPRCLLAVTPVLINGTELQIQIEAADDVSIEADPAGKLLVSSSGATVIGNPDILTADITSITVNGGDGSNRIDLTNVTTADFVADLPITVNGGDGDDTILGSEFADSLVGGNGNDEITGVLDSDTLDGGHGDDTINGGVDNDVIVGGDGADSIHGDTGDDTVSAGDGADEVFGDDGLDLLNGGDGSDTLNGDAGNDTLNGDSGADLLDGGGEDDLISGGTGNDTASGGDGLDTLNGGADNDSLSGDDGTDIIDGGDGNDALFGGDNNDTINGGAGNDSAQGSDGNDSIFGGGGNDSLVGDAGDDTLLGQSGNDTLDGGSGADSLDGGTGNDLISSQSNTVGILINDVTVSEGDAGTVNAIFTVGLTIASTQTVTVSFTVVGGTAVSGVDFSIPASNTVTFLPGVTTQTISVPIIGDTTQESSETFFVTLSNAANATIADNQGLGTITDSDAPVGATLTAGANVNASRLAGSQTEVHIAVNPTNPLNVVAMANGGTSDATAQFIANSFDGGITWTIRPLGVAQDGVTETGIARRFDGAAAFDRFGNLHVVYMADPDVTAQSRTHAIIHSVSIDGGTTFTLANTQILDALSTGNDKPWVATGPDAANPANEAVIVTYQENGTTMVVQGASVTGVGAVSAFTPAVTFSGLTNYAVPAVGPNGEVVITWQNPPGGQGPGNLLFDRDLNGLVGGLTFGADTLISTSNFGGFDFIPATPDRSSFASPYLAYDLSNGVFRGRLYAAYAEEIIDESNNSDIELRFSDDNGTTWSAPIRVNDDATTNSQFFQNISVDPATGHVFLSWYDARNDVGAGGINSDGVNNTDVEIFTSVSIDGGQTFAPNVRVSAGASNQARDTNNPNDFGDYAGLAAFNDVVYVVWADNSNSTGDNPGGTASFDVYTSRVVATVTSSGGPGGGSTGTALQSTTDTGDTLIGGEGYDTIIGGAGNDLVNGMSGNDSLSGGAGNDTIFGGSGIDTLDGQAGDDLLNGQSGNDLVAGGDGQDTYVWNGAGAGVDFLSSLSGYDKVRIEGTASANNFAVSQNNGLLRITDGTAVLNVSPVIQVVDILAGGGNDTITIGALDRVRTATLLTINGGDGNDTINMNGANSGLMRLSLIGGLGDDSLTGSSGIDTLDGGDGDDVLDGQGGNDQIAGGQGDDTITGGSGNDRIAAGSGSDTIDAGVGDDSVTGDAGADTISGVDGNDTLDGGDGTDSINGGAGHDSLLGGNEADNLNGSTGNDTVRGGANDDTIFGENGNDKLYGEHGNDSIVGYDGDDTINGGDGDDTLEGNIGDDLMAGGNGDDIMNGAAGNDTLTGDDGNDTIAGGAGTDVLLGGEGDDSLNGQGGSDTINPGEGLNIVVDATTEIDTTFTLSAALLAALA